MSKYLYLDFNNTIPCQEGAAERIAQYIEDSGMDNVTSGKWFFAIELKQEIEILNSFEPYNLQVMDVSKDCIVLYGVLREEGDVVISIPLSNILCVSSHFKKNFKQYIMNYSNWEEDRNKRIKENK